MNNLVNKKGISGLIVAVAVVLAIGLTIGGYKFLYPAKIAAQTTTSMPIVSSFDVEGGMFYYKPNEIRVKKGERVKITFTNKEGFHDFVLDEFGVKSETIKAGNSTTVEFMPDRIGTFEYYCSVGNHRQMGMKGNLIVE